MQMKTLVNNNGVVNLHLEVEKIQISNIIHLNISSEKSIHNLASDIDTATGSCVCSCISVRL